MASISPSPDSSPAANLPNSRTTTTSTPPPQPTLSASSPPPTNDSTGSPPTAPSRPNATSDPPAPSNSPTNSSSPPANAPPPVVLSAPPPVVTSASPPVTLSPPPPTPPPPTPVLSPPLAPTSPPALPPPASPPALPPPTSNSSSPPPQNPPPTPLPSPPPPVVSPPPTEQSPPPTPSPPVTISPPPEEVSPPPSSPIASPPPPTNSTPPLPLSSPPPPVVKPPESSPPPEGSPPSPPPTPTPPSVSRPASPPVGSPPITSSPPSNGTQTIPSPSPPLPSSPRVSMSPPEINSSVGQPPLLPVPNNNTTNSESAGSAKSGGMSTGSVAVIVLVVVFSVIGLAALAVWWSRKKKRKLTGYHAGHVMPSPYGSSTTSDASHIKVYSSVPLMGSGSGSDFIYSPPKSGGLGNSRSFFTYQELLTATDGFSAQNLLGEGGFGCVYKGVLADGREVAVKQLKIGGSQGEREFAAEVETISRVHHRHLVSLVGYCISEHQRLLVYDFVPNDTLYYHLHGEGRPVMEWATRVKVATGAARGISYLHEDCHPRIIHRDIKSSNILLDNNFDAQVSDFGLAKLALDFDTHVTTRVMGTFGYMAPEYASSGKLTEKSDVYSFGVVLLELITGRKPVDASQPLGDESLVEWARPLMGDALENQEFEELIDAKLEKNYVESEVLRMIEAAAACVRHSAAKRPRMGQVVRALDAIGHSSDLTNGVRPGQSEVFNSAEQSAEIRMFQRMAFGAQDYSSEIFSHSSWEV